MTKSWSIREELFTKEREQDYLRRDRNNTVEKKQTLMAVALINAGIYKTMNVKGVSPIFSKSKGGIF